MNKQSLRSDDLQKGFAPLFIVLGIVVLIGLLGGGYYLGAQRSQSSSNDVVFTPKPSVVTPSESKYTEQDGVVWVDVQHIVTVVNIYYSETKKLPKDLQEIKTLPDLSFFEIKNNPVTKQPYLYVPKPDGTGFTVSGMQSDGTEYKKEVSIN